MRAGGLKCNSITASFKLALRRSTTPQDLLKMLQCVVTTTAIGARNVARYPRRNSTVASPRRKPACSKNECAVS
jgi:hypothetical protein